MGYFNLPWFAWGSAVMNLGDTVEYNTLVRVTSPYDRLATAIIKLFAHYRVRLTIGWTILKNKCPNHSLRFHYFAVKVSSLFVCNFANEDSSLPLNRDEFNSSSSSFIRQSWLFEVPSQLRQAVHLRQLVPEASQQVPSAHQGDQELKWSVADVKYSLMYISQQPLYKMLAHNALSMLVSASVTPCLIDFVMSCCLES